MHAAGGREENPSEPCALPGDRIYCLIAERLPHSGAAGVPQRAQRPLGSRSRPSRRCAAAGSRRGTRAEGERERTAPGSAGRQEARHPRGRRGPRGGSGSAAQRATPRLGRHRLHRASLGSLASRPVLGGFGREQGGASRSCRRARVYCGLVKGECTVLGNEIPGSAERFPKPLPAAEGKRGEGSDTWNLVGSGVLLRCCRWEPQAGLSLS